MLIQFSVENFLSFQKKTALSMEAGERLRKFNETNTFLIEGNRLLKNVLLFGPNGSGKSNFIVALRTMRKLILQKTKNINSHLNYIPFLLGIDKTTEPTTFEIEFIMETIQYRYTISYNKTSFLFEQLEILEKKQYQTYFSRVNEVYQIIQLNTETLAKETRKNSLFLYSLQDKNDAHAIRVMKWFSDSLQFHNNLDIEAYIDILDDPQAKAVFLKLLKLSDFNIVDVEVVRKIVQLNQMEKEAFRKILMPFLNDLEINNTTKLPDAQTVVDVRTIYHVYDDKQNFVKRTSLPLNLESDGTKKFISIILAILHSGKQGKVLIFDEFDDSFHLAVSQALIKIFNSKTNTNQFILTSHELQHLDCAVRKDQIYLLEKDFDGESHLYSLFDFNQLSTTGSYYNQGSRHDISFFKRYMNGQFGANPNIDASDIEIELERYFQ